MQTKRYDSMQPVNRLHSRPADALSPAEGGGEGRGEGEARSHKAQARSRYAFALSLFALLLLALPLRAQTLVNVDFGVGSRSAKTGFAGTGESTNDFWNLYRHYDPRFVPGMKLVSDGELKNLKLADGTETKIVLAVSNAPGVWGNGSGDPMYDSYLFAQNGSNLTVVIRGLEAGRYHFYLYGHADPDVTGEQNSLFTVRSGTNAAGPLSQLGSNGWKATAPWQERYQFVVARDVPVRAGQPVFIDVAPGPNGVAVLNGLQIISRGTSPPRVVAVEPVKLPAALTNLLFHEVRYDGKVSDTEARFAVSLTVESLSTNELSRPLFSGDVAVIAPELPPGLRIVSGARQYRLFVSAPGVYQLQLEVLAKIAKAEPWNQIHFTGPSAAIGRVAAIAAASGVEMQLLHGTQLEPAGRATSRLEGLLGADNRVALRWQSKTTEVTRKSLVTADTVAAARITPTVIQFDTRFQFDILQAPLSRLAVSVPAGHALTRVQGDDIRDWSVKPEGDRQLLTIEFARPVEKAYALTLLSEQPVDAAAATAALGVPQPLGVERESGSFALSAEDMIVEVETAPGLRQVNAAAGALSAYRFYGRPFSITARLRRVEPVLKVADRVTSRLEDARLLVTHELSLTVEKSGLYSVEFTPQAGFTVTDVRGEGVEDWNATGGRLRVNFANRLLGARRLTVQLEQAHQTFPAQFTVAALRAAGATNETAQIGAAAAPGLRLKTAGEPAGLREIPVTALAARADEALAFAADQGDWTLTLAAERLPARVVAEVFNLITVGEGLVGGSATFRFGLIHQGAQEFRVRLPAHWTNVAFTGPNIRRREALPSTDTNFNLWAVGLQDKVWGGYTLVVTYDYQFDSRGAVLDLRGAHAESVERETGSLALTAAASLQLKPKPIAEPLRLIDPTELAATDRALITRPVLLAWRYTGAGYALTADVARHAEVQRLLDAVADRTQITSVVTEDGQMLSQATFMVKNNDRQSQRLRLPPGASLWACTVNQQPVKAEQDGDWLIVALPRAANRDEAFAVDVVYKQTLASLKSGLLPRTLALTAPKTDVPNTYAQWQLYVPGSARLSSFGGNMTVLRGTTYGLRDGWQRFRGFYADLFRQHGALIALIVGGSSLVLVLIGAARRRGGSGVISVLVAVAILGVLGMMLLPSLAKSKARATRVSSISNLKQIALAARMFAEQNAETLPASVEQLAEYGVTDKILTDSVSGERFIYVGAGKRADLPQSILAYSPVDNNGRVVAYADGSVAQLTSDQFAAALEREASDAVPRSIAEMAKDQREDVLRQQRAANKPAARTRTGLSAPARLPEAATPPPNEPAVTMNDLKYFHDTTNRLAIVPSGSERGAGVPALLGAFVNGATTGDLNVSGTAGTVNTAFLPAAPPTAAGIRSIRIDLPRTGRMFTFTKVLNAGDEPLAVRASTMRVSVFNTVRSILQLAFFLTGLVMLWREWRRPHRRSFRLAVAMAFILGSVGHLMVAMRTLHLGLIALVPALLALLAAWLLWRYWPRRVAPPAPEPAPSAPRVDPGTATPPALAAWTLFLGLSALTFASARADEAPVQASRVTLQEPTNAVSLVSAAYTGTVSGKVGQFDAVLMVTSVASNQTIALFEGDAAVREFSSDAREARLVRQGKGVALRLTAPGSATIRLKLAVRVTEDGAKRQLAFAIPPALSSRLAVAIDEGEADVEFPGAVAFQRSADKAGTRVEAVLGAGDQVDLQWTPRMKRIGDMAASVFARSASLVTLGGGAVNTRTTFDYQVSQGELRQLKARLPAGHRLLRVEGEGIRFWELHDESGAQTLTVDLVKSAEQHYKLTLETEKPLDALPATVAVEVPQVQDVIRETGLVAVRGTEELALVIETARELQRVDNAEFVKTVAVEAGGLAGAWRFLKPGFALAVRAEAIQPQIEAVARNNFLIGFEEVSLTAKVDYTIKKAGVFTLRLALPEGWKLETVHGTNVAQWIEKAAPGPRAVEVSLKERTLGACPLTLHLRRSHRDVPRALDLAGVAPLDARKLTGFVAVSAEPGVAVKSPVLEGLAEIPAAALGTGRPAGGSVLAFKAVGADPQAVGAWKLSLQTETVESWVRAEVANVVSINETHVSGRSVIRYDVQNAPVKEFRVRVPAAWTNLDFHGANIRQRHPGMNEWRIELQNKVRGAYTLLVTWEQPRATGTNTTGLVPFAGAETLGTERETGFTVFLARPPMQLTAQTATEELLRIDSRELPEWAGVPSAGSGDGAPVLAWRYLRPGWRLGIEARRFTEAALLQALVDSARFVTVVADDGQMMTEMTLAVRNNGLPHLEIALPRDARVWSAFVAGQPVRPATRGDRLLLPLERSGADDAPVSVELTYVGAQPFPRTRGAVALASPQLAVPIKNARWELYLPPDYDYTKFAGSMTHEIEAAPAVAVYSSTEYFRQEDRKKAERRSEVKSFLSNTRARLAEGKVQLANEELMNFDRASRDGLADEQAAREIAGLKRELGRAQSSNLIQAQRDYAARQIGQLAGPAASPARPNEPAQTPAAMLEYDAEAAEQQWGALQKAQEVTVARVQPLRANLPTSGQRHAFSQVLQTEVNRPMTIRFHAANTRASGWFRPTLQVGGAFLVLWILAAALSRRAPGRASQRA